MADTVTLGNRLKRLRKAHNLNSSEAAARYGCTRPALWTWEADRSQPRLEMLAAIADCYGMGLAELLAGVEVSRPRRVRNDELIARAIAPENTPPPDAA